MKYRIEFESESTITSCMCCPVFQMQFGKCGLEVKGEESITPKVRYTKLFFPIYIPPTNCPLREVAE